MYNNRTWRTHFQTLSGSFLRARSCLEAPMGKELVKTTTLFCCCCRCPPPSVHLTYYTYFLSRNLSSRSLWQMEALSILTISGAGVESDLLYLFYFTYLTYSSSIAAPLLQAIRHMVSTCVCPLPVSTHTFTHSAHAPLEK
jgi:hypothetical protein